MGYASQSSSSSAAGWWGAGRGGITSDILANAPPEPPGVSVESPPPPGTLPEMPIDYKTKSSESATYSLQTRHNRVFQIISFNKMNTYGYYAAALFEVFSTELI